MKLLSGHTHFTFTRPNFTISSTLIFPSNKEKNRIGSSRKIKRLHSVPKENPSLGSLYLIVDAHKDVRQISIDNPHINHTYQIFEKKSFFYISFQQPKFLPCL